MSSAYAVYTKWYHEKGVKPADEMAQGMRDNIKTDHPADDVIWWKIDDNHHQSVIIYPTENAAIKHRAEVEAHRAKSSEEYSTSKVPLAPCGFQESVSILYRGIFH